MAILEKHTTLHCHMHRFGRWCPPAILRGCTYYIVARTSYSQGHGIGARRAWIAGRQLLERRGAIEAKRKHHCVAQDVETTTFHGRKSVRKEVFLNATNPVASSPEYRPYSPPNCLIEAAEGPQC